MIPCTTLVLCWNCSSAVSSAARALSALSATVLRAVFNRAVACSRLFFSLSTSGSPVEAGLTAAPIDSVPSTVEASEEACSMRCNSMSAMFTAATACFHTFSAASLSAVSALI